MHSLNYSCKMNKRTLKRILGELRVLVDELEAEVLSDTSNYRLDVDYDEVVDYYQDRDSAEEGL